MPSAPPSYSSREKPQQMREQAASHQVDCTGAFQLKAKGYHHPHPPPAPSPWHAAGRPGLMVEASRAPEPSGWVAVA
eukprot:scaffold71871_cov17-Tisochrysis_lutea.AAC.1